MKLPKISLSSRKKYLIFTAIFLLISAALLTWFLQYRYFINNIDRTWEFLWNSPRVFWYNALIMLFILIFITGLTRRPIVAAGTIWAFLTVLTHIHISKFNVRGFPLLPEDFELASEASTLSKFIDIGALIRLIIAVLLIITLTIIINIWITKKFNLKAERQQKRWWRRFAVPSRLAIVVISALCFMTFTNFIRHHNGERYQDIPWLNSQLVAWDQVHNYDQNGFILGFLYNLQKLALTAPDGYNEDRIAEIHSTYAKLAQKNNQAKTDITDEGINLIIVLNESFFDPSIKFQGYSFEDFYPHTGGEILPTLRYIQSKYPSGNMYSIDYGGGTANIEFEVLTGLTNYWTNAVPYTSLIPKAGDVPSIASYLKSKNYETTAIHPFNGGMYKRNIALKNLGFNTFITELEMSYTEKEGKSEYINDRSAYNQLLDTLNSSKNNQLITLITMQNHLPYNFDTYDSTQFATTATDIDEQRRSDIAIYYQTLHNSDAYLGELISALDQLDKKVAMLFFGDHSAGIFDLTNGNEQKEVRDLSRITPYFIYTNFETGQKDKTLPTTTPNCLTNTLFNHLNLQKLPLYYLLDDICQQAPILTPAWYGEKAPFESTELSAYRLITYDILGGKKYWMSK
ncbi:MAG: sulfatase-like hydrolase/transferase [Candidatus Nomurabacteria bacterium]|jgi:phosphoglycerol transferase MdoB-like AlkP superfamily enzyme|nr:sulfatase-like hydrolase/transferase [Candidatus Nomurabacteria bacterium]